jgi:nucleotide-binding universal stress UspA family protein
MFPFRKILLPVDYSGPCQAVIPYVKDMARRFASDLTVVHAYGGEALAESPLPLTDPNVAADAQAFEAGRLREFALETFPGQHVETFAELGDPGGAVHKIAQREGTDLVMLATHGYGAVRRLLLGSVAAKVLHDVDAAVWTGTGMALEEHAPQIPYKSVLCAVDDTDEASAVLTAAAAFACAYEARLWLVQVVETPQTSTEIDFSIYRKDLMDAAEVRLRELKGRLNISAQHTILDMPVPEGVRREALRRKADIVIAGRGRAQAAFSRVFSHLYQIVRESPCPVLSI